jgi:hypothetical protein
LHYKKQIGQAVSEFGAPINDVFIGDYVLYYNPEDVQVRRALVIDVLKAGFVHIYQIDEGREVHVQPTTLLPMPKKFREFKPLCLLFEVRKPTLEIVEESKVRIIIG